MGIVRELTAADSEAAAGLVASIWRDDPVFIGRADSISQNRFATVLLAVDGEGQIVGVGTLGSPSRHSHRMVSVDVEESSRRRGIGSALLAGLREKADAAPLVSRLRPWDVSSNRFYTALGFELVEQSHSGVLDPTTNEAGEWITTVLTTEDGGIRLVDRVSDNTRDAAAGVLGRWYEAVHSWSPPRPFTPAEARSAFVDGVPDEALVTVSVSGVVVGTGVLHEDMLTGDNDLAHVELVAVDPTSPVDETPVLRVIYAELFRRAASAGKRIRLGVTDNYPPSVTVTNTMPIYMAPELHLVAEPTAP